jgi:hypothetical protein
MVFSHIRRIGRVFSLLLLLWTTVDLIDHNVCVDQDMGQLAARAGTVGQASPDQGGRQAPHADHSFCCSHTVDVQTPFRIALTLAVVGLPPVDSPALPFRDRGRLYHPPLA